MVNAATVVLRCSCPVVLSLLVAGCAADGAAVPPFRQDVVVEIPRAGSSADGMEARQDGDMVILAPRAGAQDRASLLGVKPMSYDDLLKCGTLSIELNSDAERSANRLRELDTRRAALERESKSIDAERARVNRKSTQEVTAHNQRITSYQDGLRGFNLSVDEYNAGLHARVFKVNGFNADCANRAYRRADRERLPRALNLALQKHSTTLDLPVVEAAAEPGIGVR